MADRSKLKAIGQPGLKLVIALQRMESVSDQFASTTKGQNQLTQGFTSKIVACTKRLFDKAMIKSKQAFSNFFLMTLLSTLPFFLIAYLVVFPMDWVHLTLTHVPPNVADIYILSKKGELVAPLKWYHSKLIPDLEDSKMGAQWNSLITGDRRIGDVQWKSSDSYGVLAKKNSGEWIVWWINPEDIRKPRSPIFSIGSVRTASMKLNGVASATPAPIDLLEHVPK